MLTLITGSRSASVATEDIISLFTMPARPVLVALFENFFQKTSKFLYFVVSFDVLRVIELVKFSMKVG